LIAALILTLLARVWMPASDQQVAKGDRPNIIVYMVDTLRAREIGTYGAEIARTPAIDAFSAEAQVFEFARTPAPYTRAAVASLITGVSPSVHGVEYSKTYLSEGTYGLTRLPELLQAQGYYTAALVANPNVDRIFGFARGFDLYKGLYIERTGRFLASPSELISTADIVVDQVKAFLDNAPKDRPFFLFVLPIDPHAPYTPPSPYNAMYDPSVADGKAGTMEYLAAFDRIRWGGSDISVDPVLALYRGEVTFTDAAFGNLVDWMAERGTLDDTFFVFTADHGEAFFEHGNRGHGKTIYDESVHIPLIIRHPQTFTGGTRRSENVDLLDLSATISAVAGAKIPDYWIGRDLRQTVPEIPTFTLSHSDEYFLHRSVIADNHKLIWNEIDKSVELYDLAADPMEEQPLPLEQHADREKALTDILNQFHTRSTELRYRLIVEEAAVDADQIPDQIRQQLESLGYVE